MSYSRPSSYPYPSSFKNIKDVEEYQKKLYASLMENDRAGEFYKDKATDVDLKALIVRPEWYGAKGDGVTDDTAAIQAAMDALTDANGGTIVFAAKTYLVSGQLKPEYTGTVPLQKPLRFVGTGAHFTGGTVTYGPNGSNGGTILEMNYSGTYGKFYTLGHGQVEFQGISFSDQSASTTPFIYTLNTTLHIHDNAFFGARAGVLADLDAIILGGTTAAYGDSDPTHGFQGYGTVIEHNYFDKIRRIVYGQVYANGNVIRANTIWGNCGSNLAGGAAVDFLGDGTDLDCGNVISDNIFELMNYPYAIKLKNAYGNVIIGNGAYDHTGTTLAVVRLEGAGGNNIIIPGTTLSTLSILSDGTAAGTNNTVLGPYRFDVGGSIPGADGEVMRMFSPASADHSYATFYPRSAAPSVRGAFYGFAGGAATDDFYIQNEIGDLIFKAESTVVGEGEEPDVTTRHSAMFYSPIIYLSNEADPEAGTFSLDGNEGNIFFVDLATASGSWTLSNITNGSSGQWVTVVVRNTSAGTVSLSWSANFKLGRAWADPATGVQQAITFIKDSTDAYWHEIGRGSVASPSFTDVNATGVYKISGTQVVGAQGAAVADATDAASVILRLNDLLARCRAHGLIAT